MDTSFQKYFQGREMGQHLKALAALAEDPALVLRTTILQLQFQGMLYPLLVSAHPSHIHAAKTLT